MEGNELVTNCHQLKLKVSDAKYYSSYLVNIFGVALGSDSLRSY